MGNISVVDGFERFARQESIPGWNQEVLKNGAVNIVGHSLEGGFIALLLLSMGFSRVSMTEWMRSDITGRDGLLLPRNALEWQAWLHHLGFPEDLHVPKEMAFRMGAKPTLFATHKNTSPLLLFNASIRATRAVSYYLPHLYKERASSSVPDLESDLFSRLEKEKKEKHPRSALLVGAGGLGTWAAFQMVVTGKIERLILCDPDYIEASNLNRQPFYIGHVGEGKAHCLKEAMQCIRPGMKVEAITEKFSKEILLSYKPDVVLCTTDSWQSRDEVATICWKENTPLVEGGTSPFTGHVTMAVPGLSPCLTHRYGLSQMAKEEKELEENPQSCMKSPEHSTVLTNAMIGSLMSAYLEFLEKPLPKLRYDAFGEEEFFFGRKTSPCTHP